MRTLILICSRPLRVGGQNLVSQFFSNLGEVPIRRLPEASGIVTRFDLQSAHYGSIWYEVNQYEASQTPQLLAALIQYQKAAELDRKAGLIFSPAGGWDGSGLLLRRTPASPRRIPELLSPPRPKNLGAVYDRHGGSTLGSAIISSHAAAEVS